MGLEFLQSDCDIEEFINHLYDHGFSISHRCRQMRGIALDRTTAINELQYDLHTSSSSYYIGDVANTPILKLDSCGPQAHPSKLGRQGRVAGVIGHIDKNSAIEKELIRMLRNYFKRNYKYMRYNGEARMSCHFGPQYLQMEARFIDDPRTEDLCSGFLHLICYADRAEFERKRLTNAINRLDVQDVQISVRSYWFNSALVQLYVPFLYYVPSFSPDAYSSVLSEISFDKQIRYGSGRFIHTFRNNFSPDAMTEQLEANCIYMLLQRPW